MRFYLLLLAALIFMTDPVLAGESISYYDGSTALEGYWEPSQCNTAKPAPTILIIHQWMGLTDYEKMRAGLLAAQCYNALAVDMYGKGIRPTNYDDAGKQASIYKDDPVLARQRIGAALEYVRTRSDVDAAQIAAIGYCFGGSMALELARSGADIKSVISFHGGLSSPAPVTLPGAIKANIQIHHGAADPLVPPDEVAAFKSEMESAHASWSMTQYPGAVHAFTQKSAGNDPSTGVAYNAEADRLSWEAALKYLRETLMK